MKSYIIISLPPHSQLATALSNKLNIEMGLIEIHDFPDGESYVRIDSDVRNKTVILIAGLDHPNNKILPMMFTAQTLKELRATNICLISPYLPYMRQDKRFKPGEAITSVLFANYLSSWIDYLITIDPHLHRIRNLSDIYSLASISILHATKEIAEWIRNHINSPFIIGPDEESKQWVAEVAKIADTPYAIIKKSRYGDRKVSISVPDIKDTTKTPVLVDDIISTGTSMRVVIQALLSRGFYDPVCIGVHALFDNEAYDNLLRAGAKEIVTCNTIPHLSNKIDVTDLIAEKVKHLLLS